MSKLTNEQYLIAVSKAAPEFGKQLASIGKDVFTEKGFERLQNLPGTEDAVTRFYSVALLVGLQKVDHAKYKDPMVEAGVVESYNMSYGAYMQRNRVKRIKNVNPAFLGSDGTGLKNGDSVDPFVVRKPEIVQDYYGDPNAFYQNYFSLQDFDLKLGWLTEGGIDDIVSAIYEMVDLDRIETRFALYFKVLNGALHSEETPLLDTQQMVLDSWTDAEPTDAEIRALVELVKNIEESFSLTPSVELYNAGGFPNNAPLSDMVMLVRQGIKSKIESVMAYVYGPEYLQFPIKIKAVANFGGLQHFASDDTQHEHELKPVADSNGVYTGYYSADGTTTNQIAEADTVVVDPNEKLLAVLIEKGAIFQLIQNPMVARAIVNPRGEYTNTFFNEKGNGIYYNYTKNLITISKPEA